MTADGGFPLNIATFSVLLQLVSQKSVTFATKSQNTD